MIVVLARGILGSFRHDRPAAMIRDLSPGLGAVVVKSREDGNDQHLYRIPVQ